MAKELDAEKRVKKAEYVRGGRLDDGGGVGRARQKRETRGERKKVWDLMLDFYEGSD